MYTLLLEWTSAVVPGMYVYTFRRTDYHSVDLRREPHMCVYLQSYNLLSELFRGSASSISRQPDWRLEGHGDELLHLLCHGGAEQQGLPLPRSQLHYLLDLHSREAQH